VYVCVCVCVCVDPIDDSKFREDWQYSSNLFRFTSHKFHASKFEAEILIKKFKAEDYYIDDLHK